MMNKPERMVLLDMYERAYDLLVEALAQFPREMWTYRAAPGEWTIHEIIIHITDSEANSYVRARRLIAEPGLSVMAYDEGRWAQILRYQDLNPATALELFQWLRQSTVELLQDLPDKTWANTVLHPELGDYSLDTWLEIYARHVPDHIAQMQAVYSAWLERA
jgi:uncharacterized damage-inducible protein DinB